MRCTSIVEIVVAALLLAPCVSARGEQQVDKSTREALERAIADTRASEIFYSAVIARHGKIDPFVGVLEAETRQDKALVVLAKGRGIEASGEQPANGVPSVPDSVKDACSAAVDTEKRTLALYDQIIPNVKDGALRDNLENYREASAAHQLPAFERCVARGGGQPAVEDVNTGCQTCGMAGCGCSQGASSDTAPTPPSSGAASGSTSAKPQHSCGCMRGKQ